MTDGKPMFGFDMVEMQALRDEMGIRIRIQNGAILLCGPMLLGAVIAMFAWPLMAFTASAALNAAIGVCALVWCHNGVRQCQLKAYLLILADRHSTDGGWEHWLPKDRMAGLLGNRWFVATKGAMLGAQLFGLAVAAYIGTGHPLPWIPLLAAPAVIAGTAILLLTNPKESLPERP